MLTREGGGSFGLHPVGGSSSAKVFDGTSDGGDTWTQLIPEQSLGQVRAIAFAPDEPTTLYASTDRGIFVARGYEPLRGF